MVWICIQNGWKKTALYNNVYSYVEGRRNRGKPMKKWTDNIKQDLKKDDA